ncbi:MAG: bifunctional nuclease family protein [Acidobacteria bacterium]|nr:MAG: bifunctional nuclease family protein [Acidobacteriota bacterium]
MVVRDDAYVAVEIKALVIDPTTDAPVVILQACDGRDLLPIWIGAFEAHAIAMAIEGVDPPRPLTHDLLKSVIESTGFEVARVRVHCIEDGVYKAVIQLTSNEAESTILGIDARPSDAIALALRVHVPIEVSQMVLEVARIQKPTIDEAIRTILEQLDPDDLGQYEM